MMTTNLLFRKKLQKKAAQQTINHDVTQLTNIAEKHLDQILDKLCAAVDLQRDEWDINKKLFVAVINSKKIRNKQALQKCTTYDTSYRLLKKLGIKINSKYRWFTNINEITQ